MYRLYERVRAIAKRENAYFITLTYSDNYIQQASNRKAKEWCKKYCSHYLGNDDYGKKSGRYHHHVFGNLKELINLRKSWRYGAINIEKFRSYSNEKAIAKYIARIAEHSVKENTENMFRSKEI